MQIIIPMSGFGERFRAAGYKVPKPIIEVDGKPIITHVIDMFPGETDFIFVCNQEHLDTPEFRLREILEEYCPTGKIIGIVPHKLGPVWAVLQCAEHVKKNEPVVVNYCDFTCYWDYHAFKKFTEESGCDGAIPSYRGFHPHTLWSNYYAYVREEEGWIYAIQEKKPYTNNPREEFASSGTYYFASGSLMTEYFRKTIDRGLKVGNEYYASMVYYPLIEDGKRIAVYELQHFMQWGVPDDLQEYEQYSCLFRDAMSGDTSTDRATDSGCVMLPMVGAGSRFKQAGYDTPKPLMEVSGKPMYAQAIEDLPFSAQKIFVLRKDLPDAQVIVTEVEADRHAQVVMLDGLTEGQAITCLEALSAVNQEPLTIAACDNGMIYNHRAFDDLIMNPDVDIIVWVKRGHHAAQRRPEMYGWLDVDAQGNIHFASVKKALDNPKTDPIIVGTFTFKKVEYFEKSVRRMISRKGLVNHEYYIDSCINDALELGYRCRIFEIDHYLCWGTPEELDSYLYWQSCFHKWESHPYRYENDPDLPVAARGKYAVAAMRFDPYRPKS